MGLLEFRLPDIGEGVSEGEIVEWFVHQGDSVTEDTPIVEVMTDKATVTIGAPCDGRVVELRFEVGAVAEVGQVLFVLEPANELGLRQARESSRPPASAVGEISEPHAAYVRTQLTIQRLTTEAYRTRSKNLLLQALLLDPAVNSIIQAERLLDEMLDLQQAFLPEFN